MQSSYLLDHLVKLNTQHEFLILQHRDQALPAYPQVRKIYVPARTRLGEFLWVQCMLPSLLRRLHVDVYHTLKHIGPLFTRVPVVMHVREVGQFSPEGLEAFQLSFAMRMYWTHVLVWAMKRATHVFGNSQECIDVPQSKFGISPDKMSVLHNGLDEKFRVVSDSSAIAECKSRHRLPEKYILCVGNLYPHKNYDTVVKMLAGLKALTAGAPRLVFVGDKSYARPEFFDLIKKLGMQEEIIFTDFVGHRDLVYLYNGAQLLVFPPIVASFPNPTLEAMACGVPVVATNRGAVADITDGAALLLNDPRDVQEMIDAVSRALYDDRLREDLREKGLRRARDFSWEASSRGVFDLYRRIELRKAEV